MPCVPVRIILRSVLCLALAAGALGSLGAISVLAGETQLSTIYFSATRTPDGPVQLKFVFSKPSNDKQFSPTHGFTLRPDPAQRNCNVEPAQDLSIPEEYLTTPLYDPMDPKSRLPVEKLPTFFATVVSAELARKGFAKTAEESLPYHACTRHFWEQVIKLGQGKH